MVVVAGHDDCVAAGSERLAEGREHRAGNFRGLPGPAFEQLDGVAEKYEAVASLDLGHQRFKRFRASQDVAFEQRSQVEVRNDDGPHVHQARYGGMKSLRGSLLIASPAVQDPRFRKTVVLVAEHTDDGAMGVVLNRPAESTVGSAVPELEPVAGSDEHVHIGGPVSETAVTVLAEFDDPSAAAILIDGDLGFVGSQAGDPVEVAEAVRRTRVFAGHAGWSAGQLEEEMEEESWIIEPASRDDVFTEDPQHLWEKILRRKGGDYAVIATMPDDPSLN